MTPHRVVTLRVPEELANAITLRARAMDSSISGYLTGLVTRDLALPDPPPRPPPGPPDWYEETIKKLHLSFNPEGAARTIPWVRFIAIIRQIACGQADNPAMVERRIRLLVKNGDVVVVRRSGELLDELSRPTAYDPTSIAFVVEGATYRRRLGITESASTSEGCDVTNGSPTPISKIRTHEASASSSGPREHVGGGNATPQPKQEDDLPRSKAASLATGGCPPQRCEITGEEVRHTDSLSASAPEGGREDLVIDRKTESTTNSAGAAGSEEVD